MAREIVIHASTSITWHEVRGSYFAAGLRRAGIPFRFSRSRVREGDGVPLLLGTTFWQAIENDGGAYILVDRCSFGDTERFVSLVWNGHGRRGDHKVPQKPSASRWEKYGLPLKPWRRNGKRVVLCGQVESYAPDWTDLDAWYQRVKGAASHFRPHPAGYNPTSLQSVSDWRDAKLAITLNSSIGVQAVIEGVPTVTMDQGAMAWDVTSHTLEDPPYMPDRMPWCHWLAWTQWTDDEIKEGTPWAYLV